MAVQSISCVTCGAANPDTQERCNDCGALLVKLNPITTRNAGGSGDVPAFAFGWFGGSLVAYVVILGVLLGVAPKVLSAYDPQGFPGLAIAIGVWFVGGLIAGRLSPYRTYIESALAALVCAALVIPYVASISDVRAMDVGSYVLAGVVGVLAAGLGSFLGDRKPEAPAVAAR